MQLTATAMSYSKFAMDDDFVEFTLQPFLDENGDFIVYNTIDDIIPDFENNPYSDLAERTGVLDIVELEDGGYIVDRYDYDPETEGYFTTSSRQTESVETSGGLSTLDLSYGATGVYGPVGIGGRFTGKKRAYGGRTITTSYHGSPHRG